MTILEHLKWMINRLFSGKVAYPDEFIKGMEEFIKFSCSQPKYLSEKVIRCPCKICKNMRYFTPNEVNVHIFKKGFTPGYWYWTSHGEEAPSINLNERAHSSASTSHQGCSFDMSSSNQSNILVEDSEHVNRYQGMVYGATELSTAVRMMSIKSEYNMSHDCFNAMAQLMKDTNHPDNKIPLNYYRAKKLVAGLGLTSQKINCCVNGCMLYYKVDQEMIECPRNPENKIDVYLQPLIDKLLQLWTDGALTYDMSKFSHVPKQNLKDYQKQARVEGSICQAYLAQEISYFASHYFESRVLCSNTRVGHNDDVFEKNATHPTLLVFNYPSQSYHKKYGDIRWLDDKEVVAAQLHVLINCDEVKPFLNLYEQILRDTYSDLTDDVIDKQIEEDFP
ncbi:hypothetical protein BC332_33731 [Capsicum chinense]|nr:hypothetical protein BC332_33731 [Capsicum chinense]